MHLLKQMVLLSLILGLWIAGCAKKENKVIIGGADEPTTIVLEPEISKDEPKKGENVTITDDQAITAIKHRPVVQILFITIFVIFEIALNDFKHDRFPRKNYMKLHAITLLPEQCVQI